MRAGSENINQTGRRERFWRYAPLIFWVFVIFIASSNAGSMSNTSVLIRPILEFLFPTYSEQQYAAVHAFIRKAAHFSFYFVLGALAARAFSSSLKNFLRQNWFVAAFLLVLLIAYLDETNQSFMASRTSSMSDVLIDAFGGTTALLVWFLFAKLRKRR